MSGPEGVLQAGEGGTAAPTAATSRGWLFYAAVTTLSWGVWGALIEVPEKAGFPATLGYCVWALTMVPCALWALHSIGWQFRWDRQALWLGALVGFSGAGGQLVLFEALRLGPAYMVFPFVSLYPVVTIGLSVLLLRERAPLVQWVGVGLALPAIGLLSVTAADGGPTQGSLWLVLSVLTFLAWGAQAYFMKAATRVLNDETIFAYMALTGVLLAPVALGMTDFRTPAQPICWGLKGPVLAAGIHLLNAIGGLTLVHALRRGRAIIVVPMTALAPVLTVALSLVLYSRMPLPAQSVGIVIATAAIYLMAR